MKLTRTIGTWSCLWLLFGLAASGPRLGAQETNDAGLAPAAEATATNLAEPAKAESTAEEETVSKPRRHGPTKDAQVLFGKRAVVKAGETVDTLVVIGGSADVHGKVKGPAVTIGGSLDVDGEIGEDAVAVLGSIHVRSNATIKGEVVAVGGTATVDEGATVKGNVEEVSFGPFGKAGLKVPEWLKSWFQECVLKLRPLAPQVGWVWVVAGIFFLLYLAIAAIFPRPVQACVNELTNRPATTFLMGFLTKILIPIVYLILIATGIGLFVIPFLGAALFVGAIIGKTAILEAIGLQVQRRFGAQAPPRPLLALVIGAVIVAVLYNVPVLGLISYGILSVWGLGGAITAAFGGLRREMPEKAAAPPPSPTQFAASVNPGAASAGTAGAAAAASSFAGSGGVAPDPAASVNPAAAPTLPPVLPEVLSYPRVGFWERMAAGFLDLVLMCIVGVVVHGPPLAFLVWLAYFAGMWAWKGTTIGGIVLGLKVVRIDGRPVTFAVALVRGLAAAFSIVVLFLGFFWIGWDREKQGWHDKIAGTVVIKLPRGTPLVVV